MDTERLVDQIARVLCEYGIRAKPGWETINESIRDMWRREARAVLRVLPPPEHLCDTCVVEDCLGRWRVAFANAQGIVKRRVVTVECSEYRSC